MNRHYDRDEWAGYIARTEDNPVFYIMETHLLHCALCMERLTAALTGAEKPGPCPDLVPAVMNTLTDHDHPAPSRTFSFVPRRKQFLYYGVAAAAVFVLTFMSSFGALWNSAPGQPESGPRGSFGQRVADGFDAVSGFMSSLIPRSGEPLSDRAPEQELESAPEPKTPPPPDQKGNEDPAQNSRLGIFSFFTSSEKENQP